MRGVRLTHIGGPTLLIEFGGWRLLTDPTFDPPGRRYDFGWGTSSRKLVGPALTPSALGHIDAVLLTHDQHGDNLDDAGRALLPTAGEVITTVAGARRLSDTVGRARGLPVWSSVRLETGGRPTVEVTATPCRHGPPLSRPIVGDVIGFALGWPGQEHGVLWISGDTVLFDGLRRIRERLTVDTAVLHLGGVRFPVTGPVRYTMTARDAVELCRELDARVMVPVHHDGWTHFREARRAAAAELSRAPHPLPGSVRWLEPGVGVDLGTREPDGEPTG